jgi:ribosomal protein S1
MYSRRIALFSLVLLLAMDTTTTVFAVDTPTPTRVHTGTVVSVKADTLVTQGLSGKKKEHTYNLTPAVSVSCETKPCKLMDIKAGEQVTVTVEKQQDGRFLVTKIEAKKQSN